jgi:hypothetical protein
MGINPILPRLARAGFLASAALAIGLSVSAQDEINPHPANTAELFAAVDRADKLVVYNYGAEKDEQSRDILYSSLKPKDISELRHSIVFEPPKQWFRCACFPMLEIKLYRKGKEIGVISLFDEFTIEFSGWTGDARISDQEKLLRWFDARGIKGPRDTIEAQRESEREDAIFAQRWLAAMPPDLKPLWPEILQNSVWWQNPADAPKATARVFDPVLAKEYPDVNQRIRSLFSWFGSGAGPWSGYYVTEDVPSRMLLEYSGAQLVNALQGEPLTDAEAEGAVRFFVGYVPDASFRQPEDRTLIAQLPDELKKTLLDHVVRTGDKDKLAITRQAFQMPDN